MVKYALKIFGKNLQLMLDISKRNVTAYLSMQFKADGDIISLILSNKTDY